METPDLASLAGRDVVVGLSGGVDSAVAALLLSRSGARIQALHMTNWEDDDGYCTAAADLQDARQVCERLGIPLHHVNFSAEYRDSVFQHFLDEYRAGRTPNPDVLCNREIKFGVFRDYAARLGAQYVATGHYARVAHTADGPVLLKGRDSSKDQSYFLHAVTQDALRNVIFPLGEMDKGTVRSLARDAGLANHAKKDSTGICFIGERPFRQFLESHIPARPGNIVNGDGKKLGEHQGLMYYTIGQRQGIGIGGRNDSGTAPWYVADKNLDRNELVVVQGEDARLYSDGLDTGQPNWIGPAAQEGLAARRCTVKVRYRQADQDCTFELRQPSGLRVCFDEPQRALAAGQYAVFYDGERCLGGAVIERVLRKDNTLRQAI